MRHASRVFLHVHPMRRVAAPPLASLVWFGCGGPAPLEVEMPLHLEDHTEVATVVGSEIPMEGLQPITWTFETEEQVWHPVTTTVGTWSAAPDIRSEPGMLRVEVGSQNLIPATDGTAAYFYAPVPDLDRADWGALVVRARVEGSLRTLRAFVNVRANAPGNDPLRLHADSVQRDQPWWPYAVFLGLGGQVRLVSDGTVQTYRIPLSLDAPHPHAVRWRGPIREIGLQVGNAGAGASEGRMDILSVSVVPNGAEYAEVSHGVRPVTIGERIRRTLFTHAPGSMAYRVRVPPQGRLDVGLGVLTKKAPVTFAITARQGDGEIDTLFAERYADPERWGQRSVDLSKYAGRTVTLALETRAEQPGTVALWGAPTVSGARRGGTPNVIFYVIDGGGADLMSVYGYNRRTTPNLERLAAEGAVFEHAYSNSGWTMPSTASFMTALHNSVLGAPGRFEPLPAEARTMAERFHEAGYQTAVFTSNPWAGAASNLERGVDVFRDEGADPHSRSSVELHQDFWDWRDAFPGEPYWVHFQTTDVHAPHVPTAPFAGLFASGGTSQLAQWRSSISQWRQRNAVRLQSDPTFGRNVWAEIGVDRVQFYNLWRGLFDETMAHQDRQLGRLVARLRETGQWEHTLLVIAADHSIVAGSDDFLTNLADPLPFASRRAGAILSSSNTRVPLLFVWPGNIAGGQRFQEPVSMIDVLPTVLELAGLPPPQTLQGQSLAPLLLGRAGWQRRPVIFDQFEKDARTGELRGQIAVIDGRWGAARWIGAQPEDTIRRWPTPVLLFDVWDDPLALTPLNDAHPELVTRYTALLEKQWEAHRLLATRFTPGAKVELTPAQLEALRALGYIR